MEFNPNTHKVIIDTLNKDEAKTFVEFLETEIARHYTAIMYAKTLSKARPKTMPFYESAILRHQEDICQARELIAIVKSKYEM